MYPSVPYMLLNNFSYCHQMKGESHYFSDFKNVDEIPGAVSLKVSLLNFRSICYYKMFCST